MLRTNYLYLPFSDSASSQQPLQGVAVVDPSTHSIESLVPQKLLSFASAGSQESTDKYKALTNFNNFAPLSSTLDSQSKSAKKIPLETPECIFEVPGLSDDYYTNVVDWSARDFLAFGVESNVCLICPKAKAP